MDSVINVVANNFCLDGEILSISCYGNGLINNTYLVVTSKEKYIIQKINKFVFKKPLDLMENVYLVTKYIIKKNGNTLEIIKTKQKKLLLEFEDSSYRCYKMKKDYLSFEFLDSTKRAYDVGLIIGEFQNLLCDFDLTKLHITIPFFHDLRHRFIDLVKAYRNCNNSLKKTITRKYLVYYLNEYKHIMQLPKLYENKYIKQRVCHYDTKLNNFLFSSISGNCLIDLDTVMPGCSLYDFGDCARGIIANVLEDDYKAPIIINKEVFINLTLGYLWVGKNYLNKMEINMLVQSIKVITLELSIRFLTDYLDNNVYFKIKYENQNLHRAITQLNIYKKIKEEERILEKIVKNIYKRLITM